jgi:hypothetical protein
MKKYSQVPPFLIARATRLLITGRVHFPKDQIGTIINENEDFIVLRKVVLDTQGLQPIKPKAIFKVYFHFARFSLDVNKKLSLIPIPFIIAQPGFISKTWLFGKDTGMFQGKYEWASIEDAEHYWISFPLKLMKSRAEQNTLKHEIIKISN